MHNFDEKTLNEIKRLYFDKDMSPDKIVDVLKLTCSRHTIYRTLRKDSRYVKASTKLHRGTIAGSESPEERKKYGKHRRKILSDDKIGFIGEKHKEGLSGKEIQRLLLNEGTNVALRTVIGIIEKYFKAIENS